jgi:hypothetical protein
MKRLFQIKALGLFAVVLLTATVSFAAQLSPRESIIGKIGTANISIDYGAPSVRNRKIYGGLVPYDKLWRAGANEATTFTTDKDILVEGKPLKAGKYTLFVKPSKSKFTVVINSQTGQWGIKKDGEANEDPKNDIVVAMVKPEKVKFTEQLKYVITNKGFDLVWENISIPVSIK